MRSLNEQKEKIDGASYRELRLLEEVDAASNLSQRKLALSLGIALGVVNVLIRKVARKGYIRITQSGWRRWAYVLTPAGMTRKFQLSMEYMDSILVHYRKVRSMLRNELSQLPLNPESRIAIIGTTGLAELTYLALLEMGITRIDFFSLESTVRNGARFLGKDLNGIGQLRGKNYSKVVMAVTGDAVPQRIQLAAQEIDEPQIVEPFLQSGDGNVNGIVGG